MVWSHVGHMHWSSKDTPGFIVEVKIVDGISNCIVVDNETGEIIKDETYDHPLEAMNAVKK